MADVVLIKRFMRVQVVLDASRVVVEGEGPTPIGYYQLLGCTGEDADDLHAQVRMYVAEDLGGTVVEIEDLGEPDFGRLESAIEETIHGEPDDWGIWYSSGHALFCEDDISN